LALAIVALTAVGLAIANIFPAVIAIAGEEYPHAVGTVTGALIAMGGLGGAIFPWLTGIVAERSSLRVALGGSVVLLAAILAAEMGILRLRRTHAGTAS
jgi:FHS family glucose/mannose:H+ symporter-like MFS transporter